MGGCRDKEDDITVTKEVRAAHSTRDTTMLKSRFMQTYCLGIINGCRMPKLSDHLPGHMIKEAHLGKEP